MDDWRIRADMLSKSYLVDDKPSYGLIRDSLPKFLFGLLHGGCRANEASTEIWALQDVSFDIRSNEVVGIVGRNGAGKSTLLKVLSRVSWPTSGKAIVRGTVASLLELGAGFHPDLTGRENIFLSGILLGMTRRAVQERFDEIVDFSEAG